MEEQWAAGTFSHSNVGTWHWDNTDVDRLYGCNIFIGSDDITGGHTLIADAIETSTV